MDQAKNIIEQNLGCTVGDRSIEEIIHPCAEFVTERESWMIDGIFRVDIDKMDFGHIVGEVELTKSLRGVESEEEKMGLRDRMDQEIEDFMRSCPQAFPTGDPLGKLSAYFSKRHYTIRCRL